MKSILVLLLAAMLSACATSGRPITDEKIRQVVVGQSTRDDVIRVFGTPTSESVSSDGTVVLAWGYAHVGFAGINTKVSSFAVIIGEDGLVKNYSRTGMPDR